MWVQYSDNTRKLIITIFQSEQSLEEYPNSGELDVSSEAYKTFYESTPIILRDELPLPT